MADRYPLIVNTGAAQIQELASGDNLNLTGSNISAVTNITDQLAAFNIKESVAPPPSLLAAAAATSLDEGRSPPALTFAAAAGFHRSVLTRGEPPSAVADFCCSLLAVR